MTTHAAERLTHLADQLAQTLMTAVICADEIRSTIRENSGDGADPAKNSPRSNGIHSERPLLDPSTFTVGWRGRRVRLGHTRPYWLLDRLAKHPNQYVAHQDLPLALPVAEQDILAGRIVTEKLTAVDTERIVDQRVGSRPKKRPHGVASASVGSQRRWLLTC